MTSDEIMAKVVEEPFRPFRIRLRDGRTIDVLRDHSIAWCKEGISLQPKRISIPGETGLRYVVPRDELVAFEPITNGSSAPAE